MAMTSHDHERLHESGSEDAVAAAVALLRVHGERVTTARLAVLTALAAHPDHLTADHVAEILEKSDVHRATVYRTLDLLAETGVVLRRHVPGGATQYHLGATSAGHEHLHGHCRVCGAVVSLPADALDAAVASVAAGSGFRLEPEHSTLSGVCADCAVHPR